jgi:hypothetical protein
MQFLGTFRHCCTEWHFQGCSESFRTTKMAESFHSKLNKMTGHPHLNILAIIDDLRQIQSDAEMIKLG